MSIRIVLNSQQPVYTNLDVISGFIVLALGREEAFQAITVKLECESRTRLAAPRLDGRRQDVEFELHKLLYRTQTVWPTPQLLQATAGMRGPSYVLPPGEHQFPFQFKFPFNNACAQNSSIMLMGQDFNRHVKKTLPPTLSGFPGEASIRYFVKVTAQRSGIFKENYRQEIDIRFIPTEPPRPPPNRRESFARRQHQFSPVTGVPAPGDLFRRPSMMDSGTPPRINIDGRLPDPAIITINEPIPLRILVKKLNETPEIIFLKNFHIILVGFTKLKAHELERTEQNTWVIASYANLQIALGNSQTPVDRDIELDNSMWSDRRPPDSIAPTFETCNLARWYELRVEIGLGWGTVGNIKPELSVQSLRMPVDIYSGIKAPAELLEDMNIRPTLTTTYHSAPTIPQSSVSPSPISPHPGTLYPSASASIPAQDLSATPVQMERPHDPEGPIDDPPPSYEDAVAEGLPPVDGRMGGPAGNGSAGQSSGNQQGGSSKGERLFGDVRDV